MCNNASVFHTYEKQYLATSCLFFLCMVKNNQFLKKEIDCFDKIPFY